MAFGRTQMTGKRLRIVFGSVMVVILALAIAQPAFLMTWTRLGKDKVDELRLAAYAGDVGALEWIALDLGFYGKVGLIVEMKGFASGRAAVKALESGEVDVATASDFVVAAKSFSNPGLRVLGNISYYRNKGIVARRDRGIVRPEDLRGKRIGVTIPSGAEYTLYLFLALHGLSDQDVSTVSLSPKEMVPAMQRGTIDAAITWQPHVQSLREALGEGNAATFEGGVFDVYLLVVTQEKDLAEKERAIKKLLRALVLAEDWAEKNPAAAKGLIAKRFSLDAEALEAQWQRMRLAVTLPQELLIAMDDEARWLRNREGGDNPGIPNYSTFVAAGPLRSVKPSAVTLFTPTGSTLPEDGFFQPAALR